MTGPLFHLGRLCVRRRWIVLGVWLLVFAVLAVWARSAGPDVNDNLTLPGSDSQAATALLEKRFPSQANGTNPVVLRAPKGGKLSASTVQAADRRHRRGAQAGPGRAQRDQPAVERRVRAPRQGQGHRVHRAGPAPESERADDGRRGADRRAGRPSAQGGPRGRVRRLPRSEGLQAGDAPQRGDRPQHGGDRAAGHVRHRRRDGAADLHRDHRAGQRALDHHAAESRLGGADRRADAGDDDRARGRDRLRAVHRHAPPRAAARRDGHAGVDRARERDLGRRGRVRRLHGHGRAAVARRGPHPAGDDARIHGGARGRGGGPRRRHAAAGGAGDRRRPDRQRCASRCRTARPTATPTAGRAGASSSRATRGRRRSSRSSSWWRSPCLPWTSTLASRTTARCRRAPTPGGPSTA